MGDAKELIAGVYDDIVVPGADPSFTAVFGNNNAGSVVGRYMIGGVPHGFVRVSGVFSNVDFPAYVGEPFGINDSGIMVGLYVDGASVFHGYLHDNTGFHTIDYPGGTYTEAFRISNSGQIVGDYKDTGGTLHGFLLAGGVFSTIDFPNSIATSARGINSNGQIVGAYTDSGNKQHGFLLSGSTFSTIVYPGAISTWASAVNNSADIVGYFDAGTGTTVGFLAVPTTDGVLAPAGGAVTANAFRSQARITAPAGVFTTSTGVALDVLATPLALPLPGGYSGPGTHYVVIDLTPEPSFPLPAPVSTCCFHWPSQ